MKDAIILVALGSAIILVAVFDQSYRVNLNHLAMVRLQETVDQQAAQITALRRVVGERVVAQVRGK